MKTFVIGDIHGAYKALIECLEKSNFNEDKDRLIVLGDICDGWSEVYECVETLLTIKHLVYIRGNHDQWFINWMQKGFHPISWLEGGIGTLRSYVNNSENQDLLYINSDAGGYKSNLTILNVPEHHRKFFLESIYCFIDADHRLYVHGGFNRHHLIDDPVYNSPDVLMWDRDLWLAALSYEAYSSLAEEAGEKEHMYKFKMLNNFNEVFIGHTTTINWKSDKPLKAANVWNLDTGAGYKGKLTIMNVDTKKYWQSTEVNLLYPNEKGRN